MNKKSQTALVFAYLFAFQAGIFGLLTGHWQIAATDALVCLCFIGSAIVSAIESLDPE